MKLYYFKSAFGNFGDDLNAWLWPRVIPDLEEAAVADWLVGIGTILDERLLSIPGRLLIMGTGYRPSAWSPAVQSDWNIRFVRGPLTANVLGLPPDCAISDPALLVAQHWVQEPHSTAEVGFMPHIFTAHVVDCVRACDAAGVSLIDPRWDVERTLRMIASMDRVVVEAMHGAIIANALGVPWIRIKALSWRRETERVCEFKWADWALSVGVEHAPARHEHIPYAFGRGSTIINRICSGRQVRVLSSAIRRAAASSNFQLSDVRRRSELQERMLEEVQLAFSPCRQIA